MHGFEPLLLLFLIYWQVNGNFIERALTHRKGPAYTSVLFYASWCPFSHSMRTTFETLSSMFPQVEHLALDQSDALPSVFSRYGIHSVPSILLMNQTSRVRYHGPKNLISLVQFYRRTTGLGPIQYFPEDQQTSLGSNEKSILHFLHGSSAKDISRTEPYLVFSILFLCFRVLLAVFPKILSRLKSFWFSYVPHFNLDIFGETSQMMVRVLDMIDVRRVWTNLRLCKTRNLHEGAKSARVWASLASVSLGESSSTRSSS
ncbi:5-adenylylsulfate reductase-like 5 [Quillaja saponaria]|uniref:5-adenylylsulfate reductase-like 5 n=1 Tax=Quillaja saponaria TaxID=32244 RepID=A0AAD7VDU2_QUISA|nr:5-adenylylsulfate reductase-like 5 [Quillaja saponaria]